MNEYQSYMGELKVLAIKFRYGIYCYNDTLALLKDEKFKWFEDDLESKVVELKKRYDEKQNKYFKFEKKSTGQIRRGEVGYKKVRIAKEGFEKEEIKRASNELYKLGYIIGLLQKLLPFVKAISLSIESTPSKQIDSKDINKKSTRNKSDAVVKKFMNHIEELKADEHIFGDKLNFNTSRIATIINHNTTTVWRKFNQKKFLMNLCDEILEYQRDHEYDAEVHGISEILTNKIRSLTRKTVKREKPLSDFKKDFN